MRHLDVLRPNEFVVGDATFLMSSDRGKYDGYVSGNFWEVNNLNKNGFLNAIEFWVDIYDTGSLQSKLLFEGVIRDAPSVVRNVTSELRCVDKTYFLRNKAVSDVGVEKSAVLARVSETYEGIYAP